MKTLPTKTYQRWRAGILPHCDSNAVTQPHKRSNTIPAQNRNGVRQGGSTVGVALSCVSITVFFGEGHYAGQKEADLCGNDGKHSSRF